MSAYKAADHAAYKSAHEPSEYPADATADIEAIDTAQSAALKSTK